MRREIFDEWAQWIVEVTSELVKGNSDRFQCWKSLADNKAAWGATGQFKNENWFQSELVFSVSQSGRTHTMLSEISKKKIFDYDLFLIPGDISVPEQSGGVERALEKGFGLHLKNWALSYWGKEELVSILHDVRKARWDDVADADGLKAPPSIGLDLVKPELIDAWKESAGTKDLQNIVTICEQRLLDNPDVCLLAWSFSP